MKRFVCQFYCAVLLTAALVWVVAAGSLSQATVPREDPMSPNGTANPPALVRTHQADSMGSGRESPVPPSPPSASVRTVTQVASTSGVSVRPYSYNPAPMESTLMAYIAKQNRSLTEPQVRYLAQAILQSSGYYKVDYRLIASIISVESSYRYDAVSSSGAIGLGQLKPSTAQWMGVYDPFHPQQNIVGTTRYLYYLLSKYPGNPERAVAAYFQGPGSVDRNGISEAGRAYVNKVVAAFRRLPKV